MQPGLLYRADALELMMGTKRRQSVFWFSAMAAGALVLLMFIAAAAAAEAEAPAVTDPARAEFFEKKVRPVLMEHCFKCHGGEKTKSGLRVDALAALTEGGDSGEPAIVPGHPDKSLLIRVVRHEGGDEFGDMPPKEDKLPDAVIADLERWVRDGAEWPALTKQSDAARAADTATSLWSLQPIADPAPPAVADESLAAWAKSDIDRFIAARLEAARLTPAPRADKRTLIRRATFDLTGLPPTTRDVKAFLDDDSPDAFEKVIDRLLASQEYGRRWGRHWLDIARYADTSGDGTDMPIKEAHLYRDYVIDAFNADMPFDQFIREQIAGDILAAQNDTDPRYGDMVIATGFIAMSRRFGNGKFADMHLVIDETLDTIGKGVLGLTVSCARCHDHKFDPISQEDYYALAGYFTSTQYPHAGSEHGQEPSNFVPVTPEGRKYAAYQDKLADLKTRITRLDKAVKKYKKDDDRKELEEAKRELAELEKSAPPPAQQLAWAVSDKSGDDVGDAPMMMRGDPDRPGKTVPRGFVSVIADAKPDIPDDSSGRLHLADWIASAGNPLTRRVIVNRVWLHHFGKGLVPTPDNFGQQGKEPTHPRLLDYLASRFLEDGWSIKKLHKRIMLSAVYQQASGGADANAARLDPTNKLYRGFDRQRLDAESIRDGIMLVAGTLDLSTAGPHPFPDIMKTRFTQHRPFRDVYETNRRSVYLMTQRLHKHPFLGLFDGPDTNKTTGQRRESTVPLQALFMMNSDFMKEQSAAFAKRIMNEAQDDAARLDFAHETALGAPPADAQRQQAMAYIKEYAAASGSEDAAWTSYAKLLLSSNAFLYVD